MMLTVWFDEYQATDIPKIIIHQEPNRAKKQDKTPYENPIFVNKTLLVRKYQNLRKEKHRSTYCVSNSSALT